MVIEVYQLYRHADSFEHSITKRFRLAHYGHHKAVMVFIVTVIQQFHTLFAPKRSYYLIYLLQIASFAEIGDAFHNLIHNALFYNIYSDFSDADDADSFYRNTETLGFF